LSCCLFISATKPATKRTSLNNDSSFSEGSEKPSKRVAKKQQTSQPDSVLQTGNVAVGSPVPSKQSSLQDHAMEVCQNQTKAVAAAETSTSFKRSQPCPKQSCVQSGFKPKCFVKFTDK